MDSNWRAHCVNSSRKRDSYDERGILLILVNGPRPCRPLRPGRLGYGQPEQEPVSHHEENAGVNNDLELVAFITKPEPDKLVGIAERAQSRGNETDRPEDPWGASSLQERAGKAHG